MGGWDSLKNPFEVLRILRGLESRKSPNRIKILISKDKEIGKEKES